MLTFDLQHLNKARIWLESSNKLLIDNYSKNIVYKFECGQPQSCQDRTIILELFLARGGRIIYGGLGINYKYMADKMLSIKIPATNNDVKIFDGSLIDPVEQAHVGLPEEYGKGIFSALTQFYKMDKLLLTGELDFCYAIHSEASSSSWIFQKLTYILINLLLMPEKTVSRESLLELLEQSQTHIRTEHNRV